MHFQIRQCNKIGLTINTIHRFQINKQNFRFYIKVRTALSIQARVIYEELYSVIDDEARPGQPVTETTSENIEQTRRLTDDDPYTTIEELEEQTDLTYSTIQRIISDHSQLKTITTRYIPKHLIDFQRTERGRICKENLAKFEQRLWRLCDVVTGDESTVVRPNNGRGRLRGQIGPFIFSSPI